jgi:hypothetical protein
MLSAIAFVFLYVPFLYQPFFSLYFFFFFSFFSVPSSVLCPLLFLIFPSFLFLSSVLFISLPACSLLSTFLHFILQCIFNSTHDFSANSYNCTQLTPKTASVVPPEDGRLTSETCRGLRHNKVFVIVKVY